LLLAAAPLPGAREIPLRVLAPQIGATSPIRIEADGLRLDVDGRTGVFLPLAGAEVIEIDYRAAGPLLLTWLSATGTTTPMPRTPPWHHEALRQGPGRLALDMRATPAWSPDRVPFLLLEGSGSLVVTGMRVRPVPAGPAERRRSVDSAQLWGPLRIGHTTINWIDPPMWSLTDGVTLGERLGAAFVAAALAGALLVLALRRRWRPAAPIAVVAVACALAADAVFAVRAWPALNLAPPSDAGARLRRNLSFSPETGALAALARETLGPSERVGVQVAPEAWFAWETVCFHLAPRPCVRVDPAATVHEGLSGVHRLTAADLDAVVYSHAPTPLLPGFAPVARVGANAFVARRR
jgi:hypothetical protein